MSDKKEEKSNENTEEEETSEFSYDLNTLEIKKERLTNITLVIIIIY